MTLKFNGFKAKRNFHMILNFVLFQKYEMYENKYRTKICDFTVIDYQTLSLHNIACQQLSMNIPDEAFGNGKINKSLLFFFIIKSCEKTREVFAFFYEMKGIKYLREIETRGITAYSNG